MMKQNERTANMIHTHTPLPTQQKENNLLVLLVFILFILVLFIELNNSVGSFFKTQKESCGLWGGVDATVSQDLWGGYKTDPKMQRAMCLWTKVKILNEMLIKLDCNNT